MPIGKVTAKVNKIVLLIYDFIYFLLALNMSLKVNMQNYEEIEFHCVEGIFTS